MTYRTSWPNTKGFDMTPKPIHKNIFADGLALQLTDLDYGKVTMVQDMHNDCLGLVVCLGDTYVAIAAHSCTYHATRSIAAAVVHHLNQD